MDLMDVLTHFLLAALAALKIAGPKVMDVVKSIRDLREMLQGDRLTPDEIRAFAERFVVATEKTAAAQERLADAVNRIADSTDQAAALFGVAASWLRQVLTMLHKFLDLAAQQGMSSDEVDKLRKRLPPRPSE